jgi:hypothetical protein
MAAIGENAGGLGCLFEGRICCMRAESALAVACTLAVIACDRGSDDGFRLSMGEVEDIHRDALLVDLPTSARDVRGTEARFMATEVGMQYLLPAGVFSEQLDGQGRIPELRQGLPTDVPKPIER